MVAQSSMVCTNRMTTEVVARLECHSGIEIEKMGAKVSALKRAFAAAKEAMGPQRYGARGKVFVCRFCGHDRFTAESLPVLPIRVLARAECGLAEFFAKEPPRIES